MKQTGTGWIGGPVPVKPKDTSEATGWEEPSPPSIRRKMEIDDGTSAWGDPSNYNNKTVNMWDRNNPGIQSSASAGATATATSDSASTAEAPPAHQASAQLSRSPLLGPGTGLHLPSEVKEKPWLRLHTHSTSVFVANDIKLISMPVTLQDCI